MLQRAFEHVGNDLHVGVGMRWEAATPGDFVVIDHTQWAKSHVLGIVILAKRERVPAVEPAEVGVAALVGLSYREHLELFLRI